MWETRTNVKFVIPQGKFFGLASALLSNSEGTMAEIECFDLDSVLHDLSHVRMIKIDVEGAE